MSETMTGLDFKINEVAALVQESVKTAVEEFAGIENSTVNVFIDGIETEKAEPEKKTEEK